MEEKREESFGRYKFILAAGVCLGLLGVTRKLVGADVSESALVVGRALVTALFIFALLALRGKLGELRIKRDDWSPFIALGILFGGGMFLFFRALNYLSVDIIVLLDFITPVATSMLAMIFLKEKISKQSALGIALALVGASFVLHSGLTASVDDRFLTGVLLELGAIAAFAPIPLIIRYEEAHYPIVDIVFWPFLFAALFFVPIALIDGVVFVPSALAIGGIVALGVLGALGYLNYDRMLEKFEIHVGDSMMRIIVLFTAVISSFLLLGEVVDAITIVGGFVLIGASALINKDAGRVPHRPH
ncbi:MAG: DMT family transporter [Candidatus Micrarchaeota archaeon]